MGLWSLVRDLHHEDDLTWAWLSPASSDASLDFLRKGGVGRSWPLPHDSSSSTAEVPSGSGRPPRDNLPHGHCNRLPSLCNSVSPLNKPLCSYLQAIYLPCISSNIHIHKYTYHAEVLCMHYIFRAYAIQISYTTMCTWAQVFPCMHVYMSVSDMCMCAHVHTASLVDTSLVEPKR